LKFTELETVRGACVELELRGVGIENVIRSVF